MPIPRVRDLLAALALVLSALPTSTAGAGEPVSFIALGDLPYLDKRNKDEPDWQARKLREEIAPAIRAARPPFVVHYGDIKGGGERCTDALLARRRDEIVRLHAGPVFYTPGDNEWTDCDRDGMSELERLDYLRRLFFAAPPALSDDWFFDRQPQFPENAR